LTGRCTVTARRFGQLPDGTSITRATLANATGIEVDVISYGGIITRLLVPDARGRLADIVLGLDSLEEYLSPNPYLGALIGRYGNRIAHGRFELDGKTYRLDCNDGAHHLHGGVQGFDKKNWLMETFESGSRAGVVMTLTSPDGDQGYPGRVDIRAVYELSNADELELTLHATTDKPTIVNLTQHSYFNLAGRGDVLDHRLQIGSEIYIPVGADQIPTGELQRVAASPFDFRRPKAIGHDIEADHEQLRRGSGYDHTFVLKTQANEDLMLAARVAEPVSGRVLPGAAAFSGFSQPGWLSVRHAAARCNVPEPGPLPVLRHAQRLVMS